MKINPNYRQDNADDVKSSRADWVAQARRQAVKNEESAAMKHRQTESPFKEETKFKGILESAATPQKTKQTREDSGEQRREGEKKDRKNAAAHDKDFADRAVSERIERNGSNFGGNFGGSGGFGSSINQTVHLSENFAARSILHIADLERMISVIRKQTRLNGRREITLELKRSVLEGLKVKITTGDAAQVQIEFVAANETVRSQIENHSEELANILRGRGINLQSLRTSIDSGSEENSSAFENKIETVSDLTETEREEAVAAENTFQNESPDGKKIYRA